MKLIAKLRLLTTISLSLFSVKKTLLNTPFSIQSQARPENVLRWLSILSFSKLGILFLTTKVLKVTATRRIVSTKSGSRKTQFLLIGESSGSSTLSLLAITARPLTSRTALYDKVPSRTLILVFRKANALLRTYVLPTTLLAS